MRFLPFLHLYPPLNSPTCHHIIEAAAAGDSEAHQQGDGSLEARQGQGLDIDDDDDTVQPTATATTNATSQQQRQQQQGFVNNGGSGVSFNNPNDRWNEELPCDCSLPTMVFVLLNQVVI